MKIAPTLLNYSVDECVNQFNKLSSYYNTFQIDIQDGKFITNKTIKLKDYFAAFKKSNRARVNLSFFDFHFQTLTFQDDIKLLSSFKDSLRIGSLLIHYSLRPDFEYFKSLYPYFSFGIVLNPEDSVSDLTMNYELSTINSIQIMSIHPGPQGSQFMPEMLNKIDQLRLKNYRNKILLDGAINQDTLPLIMDKKSKPDCLCVGSFLTKAENLKARVEYLRERVK